MQYTHNKNNQWKEEAEKIGFHGTLISYIEKVVIDEREKERIQTLIQSSTFIRSWEENHTLSRNITDEYCDLFDIKEDKIEYKKFYITFGQVHVHSLNGKTFDKDSVGLIIGKSKEDARRIAFELFGSTWCYVEDTKPNMEHFHRGIIQV